MLGGTERGGGWLLTYQCGGVFFPVVHKSIYVFIFIAELLGQLITFFETCC